MMCADPDTVTLERLLLSGRTARVSFRQSTLAVHNPLPGDSRAAGVRDPADFAGRPGPPGKTCDLPIRDDAAFRHGAHNHVHPVPE